MVEGTPFGVALRDYETAATNHVNAAEAYRVDHATAYARSEAKTGDAKKADADSQTSGLRLRRDMCEVAKDCAYHKMIFLRGNAGEVQR